MIWKVLKYVKVADHGRPFIDNIAVKPISRSYSLDDKGVPGEASLGIRHYVQEALISLNRIRVDIEKSAAMISIEISEF